ncbi:MAG: hypothetical protein KBD50_02820 [Candidatus Pacebacteria bacterium]|nr:hypothetical protein [Candidatus Paceibacterota bacterium]
MQNKTHIGARVLLIAGVLSLAVGLLYVRAEEPGITFATGNGLDLKIDSKATYNGVLVPSSTWSLKDLKPTKDKFWNFKDIKPGDQGENTISIHVNKDAWMCLEFLNLKEKENGENEPEGLEDASAVNEGELADEMEFFAWHDDGDNIFEVGETPIFGTSTQSAVKVLNNTVYTIADYKSGNPIPKNTTKYFGIQWCAGNMTVNVATATITCDATTMGNEAQTDSMTVDVQLVAASAKDEKKFKCKDIYLPPPGEQCEVGEVKIIVNNSGSVTNTSSSSSNTGGNSAGSGGTVITGNASSVTNTTNVVNTTNISIGSLLQNLFKKK